MERLQKIIARAGLASRREAEQWIREGRVAVNGRVVRELGWGADLACDSVKVDGRRIFPVSAAIYFVFHKPVGMLTTMKDEGDRPTVGAYWKARHPNRRVFPVGRLDYNSSGLLLLTNDGALAHRLTHPRYGIKKRYEVKVSGRPSESQLSRLRRGIALDGSFTAPATVQVLKFSGHKTWLRVEMREGKYREVRRMMEAVGCHVDKLSRSAFGPIVLGSLRPGEFRRLLPDEILRLQSAVALAGKQITGGLSEKGSGRGNEGKTHPSRPKGSSRRSGVAYHRGC